MMEPSGLVCGHEYIRRAANPIIRPFLHGAQAIPFHWHPEMEILLVLRGSARLVVDGADCLMQEDDLMIINADAAHNSISLSEETLICGVHVDAGHFERMGLKDFARRRYLCRTFLHGRSFRQQVQPLAAFMAHLILGGGSPEASGLLPQILGMMLCDHIHLRIAWQSGHASASAPSVGRDRVARIVSRLREAAGRVSLGALAEEEGVSLSHLSRLFRLHTGLGFREYEQTVLIDRFAAALSTTRQPIASLLQELGVGNASLFFRRFKTAFGCTPAELRRGHRSQRAASGLSEAGQREAIAKLRRHAETLGTATELALSLPKQAAPITLAAPHRAA